MRRITIELDEQDERQLRVLSEREQKAPEAVAAEMVCKRLRRARLQALLSESQELAHAAGYSDEDRILREFD